MELREHHYDIRYLRHSNLHAHTDFGKCECMSNSWSKDSDINTCLSVFLSLCLFTTSIKRHQESVATLWLAHWHRKWLPWQLRSTSCLNAGWWRKLHDLFLRLSITTNQYSWTFCPLQWTTIVYCYNKDIILFSYFTKYYLTWKDMKMMSFTYPHVLISVEYKRSFENCNWKSVQMFSSQCSSK